MDNTGGDNWLGVDDDWTLNMIGVGVCRDWSNISCMGSNIRLFVKDKLAESEELVLVDMIVMVHVSLFEQK